MSIHKADSDKPTAKSNHSDNQAQIIADLKLVVADAQALLSATAAEGGDRIEDIRVRAGELMDNMNHRLSEFEASVVKKARETAKATDTYVHDNPWLSISIASGMGLLFGLMLRRW